MGLHFNMIETACVNDQLHEEQIISNSATPTANRDLLSLGAITWWLNATGANYTVHCTINQGRSFQEISMDKIPSPEAEVKEYKKK